MAGEANRTNAATPLAGSGGIDVQALTQGIVSGISAAIGETLKPITEQLGKLTAPPAEKKPETADKPLTAAEVAKIVADQLGAQNASQANAAARSAHIAKALGKLPAAYQNQLGTDPTKWDAETKAIQADFEAFVKTIPGAKLESLGTPAGDGGKPPSQEKVDISKLPAFERLHMGLEKELPVPAANVEALGEAKK